MLNPKAHIAEVRKLAKATNRAFDKAVSKKLSWPNYQKAENKLWACVDKYDEAVGPGVQVGKSVRFPVADGYAHYLISGVHKDVVDVINLELGDAYRFMGECDGQIMRKVAERAVSWEEGLNAMFAKKDR